MKFKGSSIESLVQKGVHAKCISIQLMTHGFILYRKISAVDKHKEVKIFLKNRNRTPSGMKQHNINEIDFF